MAAITPIPRAGAAADAIRAVGVFMGGIVWLAA
jgi:hypothetical protein